VSGRAVIYTRISNDPEGRELGVQRQEQDCRALAKRLGLSVVGVFPENDVSASTRSKKPRPQYAAMLAAVESGTADTIIAYSNSRLTRRPMEVEQLIQLHERLGVRIRTVVSGDDDLSTADGRMVARIKGNVDAAEAERTSERTRRAKAQAADAGLWRGGRRPVGYEPGGMVIREAEAAMIRQAVKDVLAGRSLRAIAREWAERGIFTGADLPTKYADDTSGVKATGHNATRLRRILERPRNAGLMEVHGEVVGKATWPAIITEDEYRALLSVLRNPARRTTPGPERRWLGSGVYECAECGDGTTMHVSSSRGRPYYTCSKSKHVMRHQPPIDSLVREAVRQRLADPMLVARLTASEHDADAETDRERAEALRAHLAAVEADYYAVPPRINGRQLHEATTRIEAELDAITAREAARLSRVGLADVVGGTDPAARFDSLPLDRQQAVIGVLLRVTIGAGRRGRPAGWTPGTPYSDPRQGIEIRPAA